MKKIISLLLSVLLIFTLTVPAFAAEEEKGVDKFVEEVSSNLQTTVSSVGKLADLSAKALKNLEPVIMNMVLDSENWEKAGDVMMKVIVKVWDKIVPDSPDTPDTPNTPDTPEVPEEPALPSITDILKNLTAEDFVNIIKKYFIINVEDIDATSQDIVDMAEYKYVTTEDGVKTVYIMVDLEKHPELLNRDLLMQTVDKLYEKQDGEYADEADILMSYEHIAGELALHAILYAVTNEYLTLTGKTEGTIYNLWVRAKQADLNFDESRIPTDFIEIAGTYIMGVFIVSMYTVYKTLGIKIG